MCILFIGDGLNTIYIGVVDVYNNTMNDRGRTCDHLSVIEFFINSY